MSRLSRSVQAFPGLVSFEHFLVLVIQKLAKVSICSTLDSISSSQLRVDFYVIVLVYVELSGFSRKSPYE